MSESYWRIRPTPYVEHHVQQIARNEGRSLSNALHKLLTEAINFRHQTDQRLTEIVDAIRRPVTNLENTK